MITDGDYENFFYQKTLDGRPIVEINFSNGMVDNVAIYEPITPSKLKGIVYEAQKAYNLTRKIN